MKAPASLPTALGARSRGMGVSEAGAAPPSAHMDQNSRAHSRAVPVMCGSTGPRRAAHVCTGLHMRSTGTELDIQAPGPQAVHFHVDCRNGEAEETGPPPEARAGCWGENHK